jgi:hypothetical protein
MTEEESSFWGDVCSYMEKFKCSREDAIKEVENYYKDELTKAPQVAN